LASILIIVLGYIAFVKLTTKIAPEPTPVPVVEVEPTEIPPEVLPTEEPVVVDQVVPTELPATDSADVVTTVTDPTPTLSP